MYKCIVMDGSRELIKPTLALGFRCQGDLWHMAKNWWARHSLHTSPTCRARPRSTPDLLLRAAWFEVVAKMFCRRSKAAEGDVAPTVRIAEVTLGKEELERRQAPTVGKRPEGALGTCLIRHSAAAYECVCLVQV